MKQTRNNLGHLSDKELDTCECSDPQCPACFGQCTNPATVTLYRIDMQDETGTRFCEDCASDAMDADVFRTEEDEDEDNDEPEPVNFKEYDYEIPAWLNDPSKFQDVSWHNDACARMARIMPDGNPYEINVWVQQPEVKDREYPEQPRFWVDVCGKDSSDPLDSFESDDPAQILAQCEVFYNQAVMLQNNEKNNH